MVVDTLPTIAQIRARLAETSPRLADDTLDDTSWRTWRLAWHNAQVDKLCSMASDPDAARSLLQWVNGAQSLAAQLAQFKAILCGNSLLTPDQARTIADEPGKMHYSASANKMIVPSESDK